MISNAYVKFHFVNNVSVYMYTSVLSDWINLNYPQIDLGLEGDQSVEYGVRQAQEMASIIQRLINDGKFVQF